MRALLPVALVTLIGLVPITATAQVTFRSGSGMNPGGPGPARSASGPGRSPHGPTRSSAPPSHPLPGPFAGTVPDPIIRPATPGDRRSMSRDVFRAGRFAYAPRYGRWSALSGGYAGGYGAYYDTGGYYATSPTAPPEPAPDGRLALFVTPGSTQVYVDGFYSGTVADYQDRGLWLESGPHHIELRGDGYQTESFDVRIDPDRPAEYRRDLTQSTARSDAPRVAATPKTFYVIPGCYAGDTPPQKDRLPDGCSARNVRTVPPVVNRLARR